MSSSTRCRSLTLLGCLILSVAITSVPDAAADGLDVHGCERNTVTLTAGKAHACAELAATPEAREDGLMFRQKLAADSGMLFVFPEPATQRFWMKNTLLPLSIAFIDDNGLVLNIEDMQPMTTDPHGSRGAARFALEMNQGWFRRNAVVPGSRIAGLPSPANGR